MFNSEVRSQLNDLIILSIFLSWDKILQNWTIPNTASRNWKLYDQKLFVEKQIRGTVFSPQDILEMLFDGQFSDRPVIAVSFYWSWYDT